MSFVHVAWAFKQDVGNPTRKLVLVALAERCHKETLVCRPYIKTLSEDCNLSESGTRKAIKELCDAGVISRSRRRVSDGSYRGYDYFFPKLEIVRQPASPGSGDPASPGDGQEPAVDLEPEDQLLAAAPRQPSNGKVSKEQRDRIWDTLTDIFGPVTVKSKEQLRGKWVKELADAGATPDEMIRRAKSWPNHFDGATLTESALVKWWDTLGRKPLRRR